VFLSESAQDTDPTKPEENKFRGHGEFHATSAIKRAVEIN
jgi:hypothetical protein